MALTDLTRISTAGIATGTSLSGAILHGDAHFRGTQVGVTSALFDSSDNALEFNDNVKIKLGNSGDLNIFHNGTNSIIQDSGQGNLELWGENIAIRNSNGGETLAGFTYNGSVDLFYNNYKKFETAETGAIVTGILTATGFSGPLSNTSGISTFYDLRVSNNLTVEGTTTTLDTNLIGVDRVEVGANSNTVTGIAVTQSGSADILNLFNSSGEQVTVLSSGNVGIGSAVPELDLDVARVASGDNVVKVQNRASALSLIKYPNVNNADVRAGSDYGNFAVYTGGDSGSRKLRVEHGGNVLIENGNVGINSTSPRQKLDVGGGRIILDQGYQLTWANGTTNRARIHGDSGNNFIVEIGSSNTERLRITSGGQLNLAGNMQFTAANPELEFNNGGPRFRVPAANTLVIHNGGTLGSTNNEVLRITSTGKLGINEVNPTEMLHIKAEDNTDSFGGIIVYANNNSVYTKHGWRGLDSNEAIRFAISGTEKMRLTNGGKLALGRSSADEMMHITHDDNSDNYGGIKIGANNGSVTVKYGWRGIDGSETLRFAIGGTEKLRIDNNGKFLYGIGTARSGFFNTASQFNPHFQIEGAGDADDPGRVTSIIYNSTTTAGPTLLFGKTNTGSVGGTGAVGNHHSLGLITFQGMVGGQFTQGATIGAAVSGSPGDDDLPTHLSFATCADGAASASERMRITHDGKFSLGNINATPSAAFHLDYDTNNMLMLDNSTSSTQKIFFAQNAATHAQIYATSAQGSLIFESDPSNNHNTSVMSFKVDGTQRLKIHDWGDIGINYDGSPNATLDIRTDRDPSTGLICFIRNNTAYGNGAFYGMDVNNVGSWNIGMPDNTNALSFRNGGNGNSATERMRIGSNGGTMIQNAGTLITSTNETLYIQGQGHNGHGMTNTRSVVSITGAVTDNTATAGLWIGARTNENTAVIGTRTSTGNLAFETYHNGWGERFRIGYQGNIYHYGTNFSQSSTSNTVISTTRTTEGVVTSLQSISNPVGRVGTTSNHSLEVVANNNPAFTVDSSGGILAQTKSFVSKFHYNPGIQSTGGWSTNWNTIIPGGSLNYNDTYVITAYWQHNHNGGNANSPYLMQASFLFSSVSVNNTTAGNVEFVPFQTAHVGGGSHRLVFRFLPVGGHTTAAVQVKNPAGFHASYGGITVKAHVLSDY